MQLWWQQLCFVQCINRNNLCNPRDHCTHSLFQDKSNLLHSQTNYIEPPNLFTHGHNFVVGNSIVPTRRIGSLWGNECVQDDSATFIIGIPVFEWVECFDVINTAMQQCWKGESVQSHVITQAEKYVHESRLVVFCSVIMSPFFTHIRQGHHGNHTVSAKQHVTLWVKETHWAHESTKNPENWC